MIKNNGIPEADSSILVWLSYLENLHDKFIDMGLERVRKVAERLNVLRPAPFIFVVAGTNGKGTTCRTMEAILIEEGYRVGVYSSPHLVRYTERIRVQSSELTESDHVDSFIEIEGARNNITLTYFEYSTLSALLLFKKAKLDVVILEVGMGGRLDATNIIDADVAVITNVALDHTDFLGLNRESIGKEKAGIFRTDKPAVIGESNIPKTILQTAKTIGAKLLRCNIDWCFSTSKYNWKYSDSLGDLVDLPIPHVPQSNAATALAAVRASNLKIKDRSIYEGIRIATLPGRFQVVSKTPHLILDVAHNPHAANYLVSRLRSIDTKRILAVIGILHDKDISGILSCMKGTVHSWYCASVNEVRGAKSEQLMKYFNRYEIYEGVLQACHAAMNDACPEDTVLVFGSFYIVSHVIEAINSSEFLINKI